MIEVEEQGGRLLWGQVLPGQVRSKIETDRALYGHYSRLIGKFGSDMLSFSVEISIMTGLAAGFCELPV